MSAPTQPNGTPPRAVIDDCWNKIGVHGDGSCPELEKHVHCRNCPVYAAAAAELLDGELPADHIAEWTNHFAAAKTDGLAGTQSVLLFRLGDEWLALPTGVFKEVAALRAIHSLPHRRNRAVLGLANVRGELLVCVSLDEILGLEKAVADKPAKQRAARQRLLVMQREGSRLVFPVDEVHGVYRCHPRELKEVPATVAKATATYTKALLTWNGKSVGVLDDELLYYTLNRSLA